MEMPSMKTGVLSSLPMTAHSSYSEASMAGTFDATLTANGYVRLQTVVINNREKTTFVKAVNLAGDFCFVDVTGGDSMSLQLGGMVTANVDSGRSIVSPSVQMSVAECAATTTCGAMFECADGICLVKNDGKGKVVSSTYIFTRPQVDSRVTPYGSPIAFPIVTLAEIVDNNEGCLARVRNATVAIQSAAVARSVADSHSLTAMSGGLTVALSRLETRYAQVQEHRRREVGAFLGALQEFRKRQVTTGLLSADDQMKMKRIVDHLRGLNKVCVELLNFINSFNAMREAVAACTTKAQDAYWSLFRVVKSEVFAADVAKELRDVTTWGLPSRLNEVEMQDYVTELASVETPEAAQLKRVLGLMASPR